MLNYGKFFRLNNKKSDLSKGIAVFDYIWLCDDRSNNDLSEFPVYVTLSKDSIDFHAHYYDEKKPEKHLHNTILSLPLSTNLDIKDGLTGALVEGFKTNFPKYDGEGSNYLWKLHWKAFWKNKKWNDSDISYFTLNKFVIDNEKMWKELIVEMETFNDESSYISNRKENAKRETDPEKIRRFIRKLILDFMFDLEQTKVFQTSPHYEHISVKLKENYFFSALAAKANFYYWREIVNMEAKSITQKLDEIKKAILALYPYDGHNYTNQAIEEKLKEKKESERQLSELKVYAEYYLKAKMQWEKAIRNSKAEENFNGYEDQWFDDPEIEMNNVRGYSKANKAIRQIDKTIYDNIKQFDFKPTFENRVSQDKGKTDNWQQSHYYLWHRGCQWGWMPRLLISTAAAWLTFILGSNLWGNTDIANSSFQCIGKCNFAVLFCIILFACSFFMDILSWKKT
jgi:hypothetical protein